MVNIKGKLFEIDEMVTVKLENRLHNFNKNLNKLTNRFGIYFLESIYFNIRKIEKEIKEFINDGTLLSLLEPSTGKYRFVLDGYSETHKNFVSDDALKFEEILSNTPMYQMLKSELREKGFTLNVEYIHSSQETIFRGLYLRFNKIK